MKSFIFVAAALSLTACGRSDANSNQAQAREKFDKAFALRSQALSGTIQEPADSAEAKALEPQESEPTAEGETAPEREASNVYGGTIEDYRHAKQLKAAEQLSSINVREPGQQTAAKLFVGETQASTARRLARQASATWTAQADLASRLVNAATTVRLRSHLAKQYENVSYEAQVAATNKAAAEQAAEERDLAATVKGMEGRIKDLEGQVAQSTQTSREKAEESENFSRLAFTAKGQAQYDLYVRSGECKNEADAATAKADTAKLELDIERARLKVEQAALRATQQHVQALDDAIEALRLRTEKTDKLGADAAADAQGLLEKEFDPTFKTVSVTQTEKVNKGFDEAINAMTEAVSSAEAASGSAPSDSRGVIQMHLLAMRSELGQVQRQQVMVDTAYRDLLKTLQENLTEPQPDLAASIGGLVAETETRLASAKTRATDELTKVVEELTPMADSAQTGGDPKLERLTLRHLVIAYRALAAVTGEATHKEKADELVARLGQVKEGT